MSPEGMWSIAVDSQASAYEQCPCLCLQEAAAEGKEVPMRKGDVDLDDFQKTLTTDGCPVEGWSNQHPPTPPSRQGKQ